jgi:integrase
MATMVDFYNSFSTRSTVSAYSWAHRKLQAFLRVEDLGAWLSSCSQEELDQKLTEFYMLTIKDMKPKTKQQMVIATRQLLLWFKKDPSILKRLTGRRPGYYPLTMDAIPPEDLLAKMFQLWAPAWKAYFACLASSGCRASELLRVPRVDLDLSQAPPRIILRSTKSGKPRVAFISAQAKDLLQQHWDEDPASSLLFTFSIYDVDHRWGWALRRLRVNARDPTTKRQIYHPHTLRKRFRTILGSRIPRDVLEALMGHEVYLDSSYRRYTTEELAAFYKEHQGAVSIGGQAAGCTPLPAPCPFEPII